jgi:hypothetical protein
MSATPSFAPPLPSPAPVMNPAEADQLATRFLAVMDELAEVVQQETELVRLGRLAKAAELAPRKTDLMRRYFADALRLQASHGQLAHLTPKKIEALRQRHNPFRALLQINLTVLATAHAISEGIVRGVSSEMARKSAPQSYGASGRPNEPGRNVAPPLAVSRVL